MYRRETTSSSASSLDLAVPFPAMPHSLSSAQFVCAMQRSYDAVAAGPGGQGE
jgi:hypothetical protein